MKNAKEEDNVIKTGLLVAGVNTLAAPIYAADSKLGLTASLLATAGLLFAAHEVGKKSRPLENLANNGNSFFSSITGNKSREIETAAKNVAAGGGIIVDEICDIVNSLK